MALNDQIKANGCINHLYLQEGLELKPCRQIVFYEWCYCKVKIVEQYI